MSRAIVLIGVSRTEGTAFPMLDGVEDAIVKMEKWARGQRIPHIIKLCDVGEDAVDQVTISLISGTIDKLVSDVPGLRQLIIYFSGHGIVNANNEYLLLSLAPRNVNEAINVSASQAIAQTWKVPHIVLFSDACRTVAPTVTIDRITGSAIIPNDLVQGLEKPFDIFYATRIGAPALEVADGKKYVAVYTEVLSKGLDGKEPSLVKNGYIRPRPLKKWLVEAVPAHLIEMKLNVLVSQTPDARISSGDDEWLSEFDLPVEPAQPVVPQGAPPPPSRPAFPSLPSLPSADRELRDRVPIDREPVDLNLGQPSRDLPMRASEVAMILIDNALSTPPAPSGRPERQAGMINGATLMRMTGRALSQGAEDLLRAVGERQEVPLGLEGHLSGFRILGSEVRRAVSATGEVRAEAAQGGSVLRFDPDRPSTEVLIEFETGRGVVLPLLRHYVGVVQTRGDQLSEVYYEPAEPDRARRSRSELQLLRTIVSEASSLSVLNLDPRSVLMLARRLQLAKYDDPALAVYAAYAYQSVGQLERIREMRGFLLWERQLRLFDVDLLARAGREPANSDVPVVPKTPLLSQGWALVDALWPDLPDALKPLREHVGQSLWSDYDAVGVEILEAWIRGRAAEQEGHHYAGGAA